MPRIQNLPNLYITYSIPNSNTQHVEFPCSLLGAINALSFTKYLYSKNIESNGIGQLNHDSPISEWILAVANCQYINLNYVTSDLSLFVFYIYLNNIIIKNKAKEIIKHPNISDYNNQLNIIIQSVNKPGAFITACSILNISTGLLEPIHTIYNDFPNPFKTNFSFYSQALIPNKLFINKKNIHSIKSKYKKPIKDAIYVPNIVPIRVQPQNEIVLDLNDDEDQEENLLNEEDEDFDE